MASKRVVGGFLLLAGGSPILILGISGLAQIIYSLFTDLSTFNLALDLIDIILEITLGCLILIGGIKILSDTSFNDLIPLFSGITILIWGVFYETLTIIEVSKITFPVYVGLYILGYIFYTLHMQVLVILGAVLCYKNQYEKWN